MQLSRFLTRRNIIAAGVVAGVMLVGGVAALEPVTRNLVAREELCSYCHLANEYEPELRMSWSRPHPAALVDGKREGQARCVDCHIPRGLLGAAAAYLHFASISDFYGRIRPIKAEREGEWTPPSAKTAYRVRDRLFETDGAVCRACHVDWGKPSADGASRAGGKAHEGAKAEGKTCIECHYNLVHRRVDLRPNAFKKPEPMAEDKAKAGGNG